MQHSTDILIPERRIGAIIGKEGKAKKRLQALGECELEINSNTGLVKIHADDSVKLYFMKEVVRAVGRGFNPSTASLLLKQDYLLEVLDLKDYVSDNQLKRVKGRLIGKDGRTREILQELTETYISISGRRTSIIGRAEHMPMAHKAVEDLIGGRPHGSVYKYLEKHKQKIQREKMLGRKLD